MDFNVKKLKINDMLGDSNRIVTSAVCSIPGSSVVAVSCCNGSVGVYDFDIKNSSSNSRLIAPFVKRADKICNPSILIWLTKSAKLLIGYEDGGIGLYGFRRVFPDDNNNEKQTDDVFCQADELLFISTIHKSPINVLLMNSEDKVLLSGSEDGSFSAGKITTHEVEDINGLFPVEYVESFSYQEFRSMVVAACFWYSDKPQTVVSTD